MYATVFRAIDGVGDVSDRIRDLNGEIKNLRKQLIYTIMEARENGHSLQDIATKMGTSRQYVHQIIKRAESTPEFRSAPSEVNA